MKDIKFMPANVNVKVGGTVGWMNKDSVPHNVTKEDGPGAEFASDTVDPGGKFSQKFDAAGKIDYVCTIHPNQTGTRHRQIARGGLPALASSRAFARASSRVASSSSACSSGSERSSLAWALRRAPAWPRRTASRRARRRASAPHAPLGPGLAAALGLDRGPEAALVAIGVQRAGAGALGDRDGAVAARRDLGPHQQRAAPARGRGHRDLAAVGRGLGGGHATRAS